MAFIHMTARYGNEALVHESHVERYTAMGYAVTGTPDPQPDEVTEADAEETPKVTRARRKS